MWRAAMWLMPTSQMRVHMTPLHQCHLVGSVHALHVTSELLSVNSARAQGTDRSIAQGKSIQLKDSNGKYRERKSALRPSGWYRH